MPKATMHEDGGLPSRQNDVWGSGQVSAMEPKTETRPM
jgi:hypothetical protein